MFVISKVTGNAVNLAYARSLRVAQEDGQFVVIAALEEGDHSLFRGSERDCRGYVVNMASRLNAVRQVEVV